MPARSQSEPDRDGGTTGGAGRFGPRAYTDWRANTLGAITEDLERRLVFELAGEIRGRAVLDVGCGDGALAMAFRQRGAERVAGCDPDLQMIARASVEATRQQAEIGYVIAAAEQLPFGDRSFDIVSLITVLAFMPKPGLALAEIARVLRPGGRLVLGDLGKWSSWAAFADPRVASRRAVGEGEVSHWAAAVPANRSGRPLGRDGARRRILSALGPRRAGAGAR